MNIPQACASNGNYSVDNILAVLYPVPWSSALFKPSLAFRNTLKNQTSGTIYLHTSLLHDILCPTHPSCLIRPPHTLISVSQVGSLCSVLFAPSYVAIWKGSPVRKQSDHGDHLTCISSPPGSQSCAICNAMSKHSSTINYTQFFSFLWQEDKSSISYSLWLNSYYFLNVFRIC